MVESKLVELAVAGSSPVGHPIFDFSAAIFSISFKNGHVMRVLNSPLAQGCRWGKAPFAIAGSGH